MNTASNAQIIASLNAAALALRPFTVIRTRGVLGLTSDQTGASEPYSASYGHAIVSDQAVAIGVTAVPIPSTDDGSDLWYVYEALFGLFTFVTGAGILLNHGAVDRTFDSKAMRKVEDGQDLLVVAETSAISVGAILTSYERILLKLH